MKLRPTVFRKAAKIVAESQFAGIGACNALAFSTNDYSHECAHQDFFNELFMPTVREFVSTNHPEDPIQYTDYLPGYWYGSRSNPKNKIARSLALLLCAEIVKDTKGENNANEEK
jgi:hypothetical protein